MSHVPLTEDFWKHGRSDRCPIIDIHGHMGDYAGIWLPRSSPEAMLHSMDRAGIRLLCFSHHDSFANPLAANSVTFQAARRFPERFRVYLTINPHYPDIIARDLADYENNRDICVGLKFHASWHNVALDSPLYEPAWKFADRHKLLALAHTWGDSEVDGPKVVRKIAAHYSQLRFILAHSLHGAWDDAVKIAQEFPHVYLDLTAVFDDRPILEKFVHAGLSNRLLFGTDLPWFSPFHGIGALLSADISDEDRHNILHRNAAKLLSPITSLPVEFSRK
jgi:predicted TIM-barrel fold metal-dependent hydrolase